MTHSINEP